MYQILLLQICDTLSEWNPGSALNEYSQRGQLPRKFPERRMVFGPRYQRSASPFIRTVSQLMVSTSIFRASNICLRFWSYLCTSAGCLWASGCVKSLTKSLFP